ncbi:MAG: hypothetical protein IJN42_00095 [Clostridia bacterium]|nr:hypothetical protein [Clostridia bacterium]
MNAVKILLEGWGNNFLITFVSMIFPLLIGLAAYLLTKYFPILGKVFHWLSLPFECLCPVVLLLVYFFVVFPEMNATILVIIVMSLCYLGYMPARFNSDFSFLKNFLYHGLGLFSSIYKWSFCVGYVGTMDLLRASNMLRNNSYEPGWVLIALFGSLAVLLVAELGKRLIHQFMK